MKFSTALALGLAPLSLARTVHNVYPPSRRSIVEVVERDGHLVKGGEEHVQMMDGHKVVEEPKEVVKEVPEHEKVVEEPPKHEVVEEPPKHEVVEEPPKHEVVEEELPNEHDLIDGMKGKGFTAHAKTEVIIIWGHPGGENVETTQYNEKVTVTETVTAPGEHATPPAVHPPEAAASHTVIVGGPDGLIYQPEQLHDVPVGDMIIFEFLAENHTVTQSTFDSPCVAMEGGMDSGHQPNPDNTVVPAPQVAMQVTTGEPLWFYCKTGPHCGSGMVFSVNPTEEKSHAAFKEIAIADNGEGEGSPITGGEPPADGGEGADGGETPPAEGEEPVAEEPIAEEPVEGGEPAGGSGPTPGTGTIGEDGSCLCMVSCASDAFPAAQAQGVGAYGGVPGSMPIKMAGLR